MQIKAPGNHQISELRSLWKEAFGDTEEFLDAFFSTAFMRERCRCVTIDGEVAAALYWFPCKVKSGNPEKIFNSAAYEGRPEADFHESSTDSMKKTAYVYAVATANKYRGKGISHQLMNDTHSHLKELGYEGVILVPGNESLFRFYKGMGYRICSKLREFSCEAKAADTFFRFIDKEEYAGLRRSYLPEGGVIQEKENLDFLETQVKFYAGEDFLLAACREGDLLRGVELLGNADRASGMVYALGYRSGHFRTPGEGRAFAMYYPLVEDASVPGYFGLAFD